MYSPPLDQIDLGDAEDGFKTMLDREEMEKSHGTIKLNEQIDIALLVSFVADCRAKKRQGRDTELPQFRFVCAKLVHQILRCHGPTCTVVCTVVSQ